MGRLEPQMLPASTEMFLRRQRWYDSEPLGMPANITYDTINLRFCPYSPGASANEHKPNNH